MAYKIKIENPAPLEAGSQHAVVFAVNDLGEQPGYEGESPKWQYAIGLEFPRPGQNHIQWIVVNSSLHEKSNLGKLVRAAEIEIPEDFDPSIIIGSNVMAIIENVEKFGRTYSNVVGYKRLSKISSIIMPSLPANTEMPEWLKRKKLGRLDKPTPESDMQMAEAAK